MADELSSDEDPSDIVMSTSESEDKEGVRNACKRAKLGNKYKGKEKMLKKMIKGKEEKTPMQYEGPTAKYTGFGKDKGN